jgi:EAL domain-containing protein (putative c-di-GMP-specific phosphodiesterase class I)
MIVATLEKPVRAARIRTVLHDISHAADIIPDTEYYGPTILAAPPPADEIITPGMIALAISAGEMELFLQPIVETADRRTRRAEALIRWRRPGVGPGSGIVPPDRFLPAVEQDEAVVDQLTMWAIEAGAAAHHRLSTLGFAIQIGVNVSGENLHRLDFPDRVAAVLHRAGVRHNAITLEITESAVMRDLRASADILTRLRLMGFALAIDDFGTGHASLEKLRQLPFSTLKIDRGFVADLPHSSDALAIVGSVIELARNLGMTSVAEGVESEVIAHMLDGLNVGALQGYYFSPALPFDEFVAWLRARPAVPA